MKLSKRIEYFSKLFEDLQSTNSTLEKLYYIDKIPTELYDDWKAILEILSGKYKLGYTYYKTVNDGDYKNENNTIRDIYIHLLGPLMNGDLSNDNVQRHIKMTAHIADFLEPLVNRKLKLGIGPSLLPKGGMYPMLGKKYEGKLATSKHGYIVTEKLDGNRCIAYYDGKEWKFQSRNGKAMKVNFDMSNLPTDVVYDGEILSPAQVELSRLIFNAVQNNFSDIEQLNTAAIRTDFNKTSGLINSHATNKDLVYNIFDIIDDDMIYLDRRHFIDKLEPQGNNVRILPVLVHYSDAISIKAELGDMLSLVTSLGGEGLMINLASSLYEHKRSNSLLKYKDVQTMDMVVESTYPGTGKYEDAVGGIRCLCKLANGNIVDVNVGSGLSDEQRYAWQADQSLIVGKIVEIQYFALSQSKDTVGTKLYSMSFPRLKQVRYDKTTTSQY